MPESLVGETGSARAMMQTGGPGVRNAGNAAALAACYAARRSRADALADLTVGAVAAQHSRPPATGFAS